MESNAESNCEILCNSCSHFVKTARIRIPEAVALEQSHHWKQAVKQFEVLRKEADDILDEYESILSIESENLPDIYNKDIADVKLLRNQILEHISNCNYNLYTYVELIAPPSYDEAMSTVSSISNQDDRDSAISSMSLTYSELGAVLENLKAGTDAQSAQVVYSCEEVTLYYISSNGNVSLSSGTNTLRIFEVEDGDVQLSPKYYLQIFIYVYPLLPRVSPCIRTEFGAIILPNVDDRDAVDAGVQSIGLLVPREKEAELISCLENILGTKIVICNSQKPESTSARISETITTGAEYLSRFLVGGAQKAEEFMNDNTPKLIEKINPSHRSSRMSPCFSNGIRIARDVTSMTVGLTGFVVSTLGAGAYSLGEFLAPHLKQKGTQIISTATGIDRNEASEKMDAIINVTAGAVEGLSTVYQGLEQSARIFGHSLSDNTVQIVKHKYGPSAAEFTQDTFETVSNGVAIGTHLRFFKPSSLVKTAAKGVVGPKTSEFSNSSQQRRASVSEKYCPVFKMEEYSSPKPSTSNKQL